MKEGKIKHKLCNRCKKAYVMNLFLILSLPKKAHSYFNSKMGGASDIDVGIA